MDRIGQRIEYEGLPDARHGFHEHSLRRPVVVRRRAHPFDAAGRSAVLADLGRCARLANADGQAEPPGLRAQPHADRPIQRDGRVRHVRSVARGQPHPALRIGVNPLPLNLERLAAAERRRVRADLRDVRGGGQIIQRGPAVARKVEHHPRSRIVPLKIRRQPARTRRHPRHLHGPALRIRTRQVRGLHGKREHLPQVRRRGGPAVHPATPVHGGAGRTAQQGPAFGISLGQHQLPSVLLADDGQVWIGNHFGNDRGKHV